MNDQNNQQGIIGLLAELRDTPARDPDTIAQGRTAFLKEVEQLSAQPVSISPFQRLISVFSKPQPRLRFSTLTIGIILGILLLSFSSSVYAARRSQPNQFLYPFKLWLENSRLSFTQRPGAQIDLRLDYAEERLAELEGYSDNLTDPALARTIKNFDRQITALEGLIETYDLEPSQRERLELVEEEYKTLYEHEEDESTSPDDSEEELEDQSETETEAEPSEDPEDQDEDHPENEMDETETETPDDEVPEEETEEPDSAEEDDKEKEKDTPEPTPEETDDSESEESEKEEETPEP